MLAVLKGIPLIQDIRAEGNSRSWIMTIDGHPARGEIFSEAFSISLFLNDLESLPKPCLAYVTLLLQHTRTSMIMLYSSQRMGDG